MIHADFQTILVPEDKGKKNSNKSYTNKCQNHVGCSCGYKLVCVDDKFSKPSKSYLGKVVYNFISRLIKESKQ